MSREELRGGVAGNGVDESGVQAVTEQVPFGVQYCDQCGAAQNPGALFCPVCGAALASAATTADEAALAADEAWLDEPEPWWRHPGVLLLLSLGMVVVSVIITRLVDREIGFTQPFMMLTVFVPMALIGWALALLVSHFTWDEEYLDEPLEDEGATEVFSPTTAPSGQSVDPTV